jgi:hypothetical protein
MGWEKYAPYRREYFLGENGGLDLNKTLVNKRGKRVGCKKSRFAKMKIVLGKGGFGCRGDGSSDRTPRRGVPTKLKAAVIDRRYRDKK